MEPRIVQSAFSSVRIQDEGSTPPHLLCSSCSKPLINCFQTPHGCRLCQQCVTSKLLPSNRRVCPCIKSLDRCRDEAELIEHLVSQASCLPDSATRKEVLELEVRCPNSESGCQKQLKLKQLDSHLTDECEFEFATCDLCSERVHQFELNGSHRSLQSADCCPKLRAACPHCGDSTKKLDRLEFAEHLKTCPERPSDCKYRESVGCQTTRRMSQLDEHYSSGADGHLELTVHRFQREMERKDAEMRDMSQALKELQARELRDTELLHLKKEFQNVKAYVDNLLAREKLNDDELDGIQKKLSELKEKQNETQKLQSKTMEETRKQLDTLQRMLRVPKTQHVTTDKINQAAWLKRRLSDTLEEPPAGSSSRSQRDDVFSGESRSSRGFRRRMSVPT